MEHRDFHIVKLFCMILSWWIHVSITFVKSIKSIIQSELLNVNYRMKAILTNTFSQEFNKEDFSDIQYPVPRDTLDL